MKIKPLCVGRYVVSDVAVHIWLHADVMRATDATTEFGWTTDGFTTIRLTCHAEWHAVVKDVVHELMECATHYEHVQYLPEFTTMRTNTSEMRVFHMTHAELTRVCDAVGDVLTYLLPRLATAWRKMRARQRALRRSKKC